MLKGGEGSNMMTSDERTTRAAYPVMKERLWNQPRPRQVLERLEQHRAPLPMLETTAQQFVAGRHGDAEIHAAIYYELLRNRDRVTITQRVGALRDLMSRIHHDLAHIASELAQLTCWESHKVLAYTDRSEFLEKELGLSDHVASALAVLREQAAPGGFDTAVQLLIKGYVAPSDMEVRRRFPNEKGHEHAEAS